MTHESKWIHIADAAAYKGSGITPQAVLYAARSGNLEALTRPSGEVYAVSRADLDAWVPKGRAPAGQDFEVFDTPDGLLIKGLTAGSCGLEPRGKAYAQVEREHGRVTITRDAVKSR